MGLITPGNSVGPDAFIGCPWLVPLLNIPDDATWPRLMSGPHPAAVGSFGAELIDWAEARIRLPLRWWQRLALTRILEHDDDGLLVWPWWLVTTARQVGKSWLLRELLLWRIHQADRWGEPQLVLHTGKDLPVCREVQRGARAWARQQDGYSVRETNGQEEIETPDGSRWLIRGRGSIYGYSASLGAVDEAWKVAPEIVEDGLEPTMAERASPQLGLLSTAHRMATQLMPSRRQAAIEQLDTPTDVLLLEWSAQADAQLDDRSAWRQASPHWSARRERLIDAQHDRALIIGPSDDPDEPDPVESFRSQWLNIWPSKVVPVGRTEALLAGDAWQDARLLTDMPTGPLVLVAEDFYGRGACALAAGRLADGRLFAWGVTAATRAGAFGWIAQRAGEHPGSRLLVGAALADDPAGQSLPVVGRTLAGASDTRVGLALLRESVATGALAHDGGRDLTDQALACRVAPAPSGGLNLAGVGRADLVRALAWAVGALTKPAATQPRFVVR